MERLLFATRLVVIWAGLISGPVLAATPEPLILQDQGSFTAGGTVMTASGTFDPRKPLDPAGQTFHGDHVYAFYQKPVDARKYPIVMWHGAGQFTKAWETTEDGREGFQTIFLRRHFTTYLIDQPRRGNAGRGTVEATIKPTNDEQLWYNQFRIVHCTTVTRGNVTEHIMTTPDAVAAIKAGQPVPMGTHFLLVHLPAGMGVAR